MLARSALFFLVLAAPRDAVITLQGEDGDPGTSALIADDGLASVDGVLSIGPYPGTFQAASLSVTQSFSPAAVKLAWTPSSGSAGASSFAACAAGQTPVAVFCSGAAAAMTFRELVECDEDDSSALSNCNYAVSRLLKEPSLPSSGTARVTRGLCENGAVPTTATVLCLGVP